MPPINDNDLVIHFLNVGFGDNIVVEFPAGADGVRPCAVVDCANATKTISYLDNLMPEGARRRLAFVCATHPHSDHIRGIRRLLEHPVYRPHEFWDCGFRHNSLTYQRILETLAGIDTEVVRVSGGMERYFGRVRLTVLSPTTYLRNRYATYGVDINNASIVLRLEHHGDDVLNIISQEYEGNESIEAARRAGRSVVLLAGDAEFESWTQISRDYPIVVRTSAHRPLVQRMVNYLNASVMKVSHHGSMHSAPLDMYEKITPSLAIISTHQKQSTKDGPLGLMTRDLFPHSLAVAALEEIGARILTTDGSYETAQGLPNNNPGTIVVAVPPGGTPGWRKLADASSVVPERPTEVDAI